MSDASLNVLLVEDSDDDAQLLLRELKRAGIIAKHRRVQTRVELEKALEDPPDIILCDYSLPDLDAPTALAAVRARAPDVPFIVVSGTIGEETAVEVMRAGANDYLLKQNLQRLAPAMIREVREARMRADRRRVERAREKAEASFRLIVESSPDLVVVHRDGRIVYANPTSNQRLGYDASQPLVGKPLDALVVEARRKTITPTLGPTEARGAPEQLWRRSDGKLVPVEIVTSEVDFDGEPAFLVLARDLTERDQIAAGMVEMDRMASIGVLAAGVGHEINNPLAYVLANLEFVVDEIDQIIEALAPEARARLEARIVDLRQELADTTHGAQRVRDIVCDLRTFSRGQDEKLTLVDVRQVLDSSVRMAAVQIRQRAMIEKDYADVPAVLANESRLGQVFLNLVVNAAQAMPEGAPSDNRIELVTRNDDGYVVVEIADSGTGIPPEVMARIFEPFYTTKPSGQGTGLGLSICRRIVESLGGEISVKSEVGTGTRFTVRLPSAATASERAVATPVPRTPASKRARILCVDDEPALGIALKRVLGEEHDVVVLTSAVDARDRVAAGERYDVVLCDLMMPGMNGMELHDELTRIAPAVAARMVFLTGGAFTAQARDFLASIPNRRLEKPVGVADLRSAIERVLGRDTARA